MYLMRKMKICLHPVQSADVTGEVMEEIETLLRRKVRLIMAFYPPPFCHS